MMSNILWKNSEIDYLIKNFSFNSNNELAIHLGRTIYSVSKKAQKLNLTKDIHYMNIMTLNRNRYINTVRKLPPNRNLTYYKLKEIALKFKSRYEFQQNDSRAYALCLKRKILDDVCSHMFNKRYSIPQLLLFEMLNILLPDSGAEYDNRKLIRPYEIDIYLKKHNLGFEYNGKYWHRNFNSNDDIKIKLCDEKNINLIIIHEKSKHYISDIKNQLIDNLNFINNVCKSNIIDNDILNIDESLLFNAIKKHIIHVDDVVSIVSKYKFCSDFRKNEYKIYEMLVRYKQLDRFTNHLIRKKNNMIKK